MLINVDDDDDDGVMYYDPDDYVEKMMLETKVKAYVAQEEHLKNNMSKIYAIVWGQCSSCLQYVIKMTIMKKDTRREMYCGYLKK